MDSNLVKVIWVMVIFELEVAEVMVRMMEMMVEEMTKTQIQCID
jgi:hypothetical protein